MEIHINISVRNPDWYWKEDDYQKSWIAINGDKIPKYSPMTSFKIDAEVQKYVKGEKDSYLFKVSEHRESQKPCKEVFMEELDVTEFV